MGEPVGGLRRRLIKDNLYLMLYNSLDALGWFDTSISSMSVELVPEQIDSLTEITPNKVGIASEDFVSEEYEMGSYLDEDVWEIFVDIFAEGESVGVHLSGDIYDIFRGKIAGRSGPNLNVYDLTATGEPYLFTCGLQEIELSRVREWEKPFNKYWWVIRCEVVDYYFGEG